jgi:hypothetical protein
MGGVHVKRSLAIRRPAARHLIEAALAKLPPFEGKPTEDISEYLAECLWMTSAHEVPLAFLSNELIMKRRGNAGKWLLSKDPGHGGLLSPLGGPPHGHHPLLHPQLQQQQEPGGSCKEPAALQGLQEQRPSNGSRSWCLRCNTKGSPTPRGHGELRRLLCQIVCPCGRGDPPRS